MTESAPETAPAAASAPESAWVYAPGSVSNLGPGFDCLGVAVAGCGDRVRARRTSGAGVRVGSVSEPRIPLDPQRNTAAIAAAHVLKRSGARLGLELDIEKGLPLSGGLGGSAASAVAGALAAQTVLGTRLSLLELCALAVEAEAAVAGRHADNVAPSLLGGGVLVQKIEPLTLTYVRIASSIQLALATPAYEVETRKGRAALPAQVPRADAVAQAANLASLVLGLERGDVDLIRAAVEDRIAEPARAALVPGYAQARQAGLEAGALGVALSGAGPTVVALVLSESAERVAAAFAQAYECAGHAARAWVAKVDARGAYAE